MLHMILKLLEKQLKNHCFWILYFFSKAFSLVEMPSKMALKWVYQRVSELRTVHGYTRESGLWVSECKQVYPSKKHPGDFPGGPVVKNPPSNARDVGSIPGQGTKIPHAAGQLSPCVTIREAARRKKDPAQLRVIFPHHSHVCSIHLSSFYSVSGTVLRTLTTLTNSTFITTLWDRFYYSNCSEEETKAQKG